ncbi:MAG: enoyl-CoA hydratase/isomerase family protein [Actinomycetota bacterium]
MSEPASRDPVRVVVDGPVASITIDRPERRNAITAEVVSGIARGLDDAGAGGARVVVLTGSGDRSFCAGADLSGTGPEGPLAQHARRAEIGELFQKMRTSPLPIVARVNGHALAGGFGLMLACDLVVASSNAEMGTPEIDLGLWPFMVSAVMQRDLPRKVALELMFSGRRMTAEEGRHWGFVNRVAEPGELDDAVADTAGALAAKSPAIVALGKRSFYRAEDMGFDAALDHLAGMLSLCLQSEDATEGIAAFLQKRAPEWKGR